MFEFLPVPISVYCFSLVLGVAVAPAHLLHAAAWR